MEGGDRSDFERDEEDDSVLNITKDRFRLTAISIAEAEAKKNCIGVAEPVVACIADLAFKFSEHLAKDLELFAQHAGRKTVNMEDVILSAHRNEQIAASLRSFSNDLRNKDPGSDRKRKKGARKEEKTTSNVVHILDH